MIDKDLKERVDACLANAAKEDMAVLCLRAAEIQRAEALRTNNSILFHIARTNEIKAGQIND